MSKLRVTYHNGRRRRNGSAYNAKHNSRSGGIGAHIDMSAERKNIYITIDEFGKPTMHEKVDFDEHEQAIYTRLFEESLKAQNQRYIKNSHSEKVLTMRQYRQSRPPEESVFQIGKANEMVEPSVTLSAVGRWVDEMTRRFGKHWKIIDIAIHYDEPGTDGKRSTNASGHAHVRAVWCADGKDGYTVSENKALKQLGFERPDMDKPQSRYNNPKITFTQQARDLWVSKVQELDVEVETVPETPGKRSLTKEEHIAKKLKVQLKELTQVRDKTALETADLAKERDNLKEETKRLRGALERFKRIFGPIANLWTKLSRIKFNEHKSVLDEVLLSADTADSMHALKELEECI